MNLKIIVMSIPCLIGCIFGSVLNDYTGVLNFSNIVKLKAASPRNGAIANVAGVLNSNDGGGGVFAYDSLSTAAFDGGMVIKPNSSINGRWFRINTSKINVKFFPKGAGADSDRVQIQSALDYADSKGGGTVFLPTGEYSLNCLDDLTQSRKYSIAIGSNTKLIGDGMENTRLVLQGLSFHNGQGCRVIVNKHQIKDIGNKNISFEDFSIDGSSNLQDKSIAAMFGIRIVYTENVKFNRIRMVNIYGTDPDTGEGAAFDVFYSRYISYTDCEATRTRDNAPTGSGFSANYSTGIEYKGCRASKSTTWQGFTNMQSRNISYSNCHAFLNRRRGFNSESSFDVQYVNCISGGKSSVIPSYPDTSGNISLGNEETGFNSAGSQNVIINNCISEKNGSYGFYAGDNSNGDQNVSLRIIGGVFKENGTSKYNDCQMFFQEPRDALATRLTGGTVFPNEGCLINIKGKQIQTPIPGPLPSPPIPISSGGLVNPYPFDVTVYVFGCGVYSVSVSGRTIGGMPLGGGSFNVPASGSIQVWYNAGPSGCGGAVDWTWFAN